jgi:uncharacterized protein (TIGR02147 family)
LAEELSARKGRNPAYSLRAFAQQSGVSPATLSGLISGKRVLTAKTAGVIAERLSLSPEVREALLMAVTREHPLLKRVDREASVSRTTLGVDQFRVIADWQHYAILALARLPNHRADPAWIAKRLGIPKREARLAVHRLTRLAIVAVENGRLRRISGPLKSTDDIVSRALRKHHRQALANAEKSLDRDALDKREFSTITMAIDPVNLPSAKLAIRKFRDSLSELLENGKPQRVYTLSLQLFPVDKEESK